MKRIMTLFLFFLFFLFLCGTLSAKPPKKNTKSKFYDFNEQLIDGEIKKPTALYTDARQRARFERLLSLKKSFIPKLYSTSKDKIFK